MSTRFIDITGRRYGRLTVMCRDGWNKHAQIIWRCRCDCGREHTVVGHLLRYGRSNSCGRQCALRQRTTPHDKEYQVWINMRRRSADRQHPAYGTLISKRWTSFKTFLRDMGHCPPDHVFDRKDKHKGYFPSNCRWATRYEQMSSLRHNHTITIDGETKTVREWARSVGMNGEAIRQRFNNGWDAKEVLTLPIIRDRRGVMTPAFRKKLKKIQDKWPCAKSPAEAKALDALEHGPLTAPALLRLGIGTYVLVPLVKRGIVMRFQVHAEGRLRRAYRLSESFPFPEPKPAIAPGLLFPPECS